MGRDAMARRSRFLDSIAKRPILLDAGIGLRLIHDGRIGTGESSSRANLAHSEAILNYHREDIAAGSDAIFTNTFTTSRPGLVDEGLENLFETLNRRAVSLARQVAGSSKFVIGSIGPTQHPISDSYREQAQLLEECGVDALILETHTFEPALLGVQAISGSVSVPILVSLYVWPDDAIGAAKNLLDDGASAIGANCGISSSHVLRCIERLAGRIDAPLLAKPSAGLNDSPKVFEELAATFREMGVQMMGGCCGVTSAHLSAMRRGLD